MLKHIVYALGLINAFMHQVDCHITTASAANTVTIFFIKPILNHLRQFIISCQTNLQDRIGWINVSKLIDFLNITIINSNVVFIRLIHTRQNIAMMLCANHNDCFRVFCLNKM
ncbi:Uncharacterised protein [Chlamydia trachomatis]|nr:Uncharacterised protein [Chlamydia trachomatis]